MNIEFRKKTKLNSGNYIGGYGGGSGNSEPGIPFTYNAVGDYVINKSLHSVGDIVAHSDGGVDDALTTLYLNDLGDVDLTGKQNGYVLTYNGATTKWEPKPPASGGGISEVHFSDIKGIPTDNTSLSTSLGTKVDKVSGKGLSTNDYTTAEKGKVASSIQTAKIGTVAVTKSGTELQFPAYPTTLPASDVHNWAKALNKPTYTAEEVGAIAVGSSIKATDSDKLGGIAANNYWNSSNSGTALFDWKAKVLTANSVNTNNVTNSTNTLTLSSVTDSLILGYDNYPMLNAGASGEGTFLVNGSIEINGDTLVHNNTKVNGTLEVSKSITSRDDVIAYSPQATVPMTLAVVEKTSAIDILIEKCNRLERHNQYLTDEIINLKQTLK